MATRALIRVIPRQEGIAYDKGHMYVEESLVNIYHHYDGNPEYLAAQLVKELKTGDICDTVVGNVYLYPRNPYKYDAEYIYTLYPKINEPTYIAIYKNFDDEVIFVGTSDKLIKKYDRQRDKSISSTSS